MTALPPAGWYPDPEAGGTRWRWWSGSQWAPPAYGYDPAARAHGIETQRAATSKYGTWLRWAMVANAAGSLLAYGGIALFLHSHGFHFITTDADGTTHVSGSFAAMQIATLPLNLVAFALLGSLIAWTLHAGNFAQANGWPSVRGRTLGAFSVLIPFVNFWWPYEAIRDSYPPRSSPPVLLRWWLSYLIVPITTGAGLMIVGAVGSRGAVISAITIAAGLLAVPVRLGWQLVNNLESMQRAN